jgi:hypothetical protein
MDTETEKRVGVQKSASVKSLDTVSLGDENDVRNYIQGKAALFKTSICGNEDEACKGLDAYPPSRDSTANPTRFRKAIDAPVRRSFSGGGGEGGYQRIIQEK